LLLVESTLPLFRNPLLPLTLGESRSKSSFTLSFTFMGSDSAKKASLRRRRLVRDVDKRCTSFAGEFFLAFGGTILLVLHAGGE
jgi:hypothetical protein